MRILMLSTFGLLLMFPAFCQETPKTMLKISARLVQSNRESNSFSSQPKTTWRAGTRYARIAESPDTQNHVHGLMIINEPDAWMINLFDNSARHIVDAGPSLSVHIPVFQVSGEAKNSLDALEFGKELEFFTERGVKRSGGKVINRRAAGRYDIMVSGNKLVLWTDAKSKKPIRMSLMTGTGVQTIEYLGYEDDLPFDPSLFQPPSGISVHDSK